MVWGFAPWVAPTRAACNKARLSACRVADQWAASILNQANENKGRATSKNATAPCPRLTAPYGDKADAGRKWAAGDVIAVVCPSLACFGRDRKSTRLNSSHVA